MIPTPQQVCHNGGTYMHIDKTCKCPFGFKGEICQLDLGTQYIVVGSFCAALFVCLLCIFLFILYQKLQDSHTPTATTIRVHSVRRRPTLSRRDRTYALASVESPPDYQEAVGYEPEESSTNSSQNTDDAGDENANRSRNSGKNSKTKKNTNLKTTLSFASKILERVLVSRRPRVTEAAEGSSRQDLRRCSSVPSQSMMTKNETPWSTTQQQPKNKKVRGPNRAISIPGKVVQVTMECEN
ncbi:uncharacterized protein [Antedon mediterranea]|uniref:uncharacterized protein isoform X1 n=1 Tax=Antedon mediterranea TaxID=105859 RepID=UPI003AF9297D